MWIQTTLGFVSIVLADTEPGSGIPDPDHFMVRARRREHLAAFQREHPALQGLAIQESRTADYRWRLAPVPKETVALVIADAIRAVHYRNFKRAVAQQPVADHDYEHLLHEVWTVLRRMQG